MLCLESYLTGSKSDFYCLTNYALTYLHPGISLFRQFMDSQLKVTPLYITRTTEKLK